MNSNFVNILVLGDKNKIMLYDSDYPSGEKIIKMKYDDIENERKKILSHLFISRDRVERLGLPVCDIDYLIKKIKGMSEAEFIVNYNHYCDFDDDCNAYIIKPLSEQYYSHAVCYDERLKLLGEEGPMATPFKLLDGTLSYSSKKGEIDWEHMHGRNRDLYTRVWNMCVDGLRPNTDKDAEIYEIMKDKKNYFSKFSNCDEYVTTSTNFWCHMIIFENGRIAVMTPENCGEWTKDFYENFIKPIDDETKLTIYEAKANF